MTDDLSAPLPSFRERTGRTAPASDTHSPPLEALMNVNDIVQERIDAARRKTAAKKRARQELAEARNCGLEARHAAKLRRWAKDQQ